ncbi:MAG: hypothetical protein A2Z34_06675 [Planctomycetes bacterium RBG_16_59_8]|nr:MAG: hypothetical protein A2Z34_06675 [Planctomycetes bacterium RBG_16_59_8]
MPELRPDSPIADFIAYALMNNPRVEAAFFAWEAEVREITIAQSLPDPQLTIGPEIQRSIMKFLIGVVQDIPWPEKLALRAEAVSAGAIGKRYLFEDEMLKTVFRLHVAYYRNGLLIEKISLARRILELVNAGESSIRSGFETGIANIQDLSAIRSEQSRLRAELAGLEDSYNVARAQWREALGVAPSEPLPPIPPTRIGERLLPDEDLLNRAMENNVRLKALAQEIRRAETLVELAYKENAPDIGIGMGADPKQTPWTLMPEVSLTLPLWRKKIAAEIASAHAREKGSRSMLSAAELEWVVTLAEKTFMWRELRRQTELIEKQLIPLAEAKLNSLDARYTTGMSGFVERMEATVDVLELKVRLADAVAGREIVYDEISLSVLSNQPEESGKIFGN